MKTFKAKIILCHQPETVRIEAHNERDVYRRLKNKYFGIVKINNIKLLESNPKNL